MTKYTAILLSGMLCACGHATVSGKPGAQTVDSFTYNPEAALIITNQGQVQNTLANGQADMMHACADAIRAGQPCNTWGNGWNSYGRGSFWGNGRQTTNGMPSNQPGAGAPATKVVDPEARRLAAEADARSRVALHIDWVGCENKLGRGKCGPDPLPRSKKGERQ
ncbi:MAG: hypothetical protein PHT12_02730 [Patescibacteria group bacterium]|nr:hypothetical protein [Patescibacteria group bacterium]